MDAKDVLKLVSGSCAVYSIMAACGSGTSPQSLTSGDGGGGSSSGSKGDGSGGVLGDGAGSLLDVFTDPTPTANADQSQSGTRLKLQYYAGADGSKQVAGMFDSQLNVPCSFGKASDGVIRCLPAPSTTTVTAITANLFSDAKCSQPVGVTTSPCSQTPSQISVTVTDTNSCTATTTIYQAGPQFTGPLYQLSSSTCTAYGMAAEATLISEGWKFYQLGSQIQPPDPTQYVEATLQTEP